MQPERVGDLQRGVAPSPTSSSDALDVEREVGPPLVLAHAVERRRADDDGQQRDRAGHAAQLGQRRQRRAHDSRRSRQCSGDSPPNRRK